MGRLDLYEKIKLTHNVFKKEQPSCQVDENVSAHDVIAELLDWAMERYQSEVAERPDVNIYKKTLNTTWQQVLEKLGETKAKLSH